MSLFDVIDHYTGQLIAGTVAWEMSEMALYQITENSLQSLPTTSFQEESLWERRDLQRLLKTNIEAIDSDILVISEEFGDWNESGRRIDLLAIDKDANLVVIEIKRTEDGGHMELQAIRYAAMVANLTWEQAKQSFQKYLSSNGIDSDAESLMCEFLGWSQANEDDFAHNVRIILVSANFSKEITTSVLWLNDRDLDIICVRLSLHKIDDKLVLSADQIIPLPEAESYQIEVRQKRREERVSRNEHRDRSLYDITFNGEIYRQNFKKSDIGYHTVTLLHDRNLIDQSVFEFLRADTSCSFQLLKKTDELTDTERRYRKYRFNNEAELIFNGDGYYIARNWSLKNVPRFINKIKQRFPEIGYSSESEEL